MATPHSPALHPSAALNRWRRIEALLHAWLEQRRRLLVLLCSIQGLEGFQRPGSIENQVREFCQLLMDYISAGHFEIYQELVREARLGAAHRGGTVNLASRILHQLDPSTEEALAFNEDFDTDDHCLSTTLASLVIASFPPPNTPTMSPRAYPMDAMTSTEKNTDR